MERSNLGILDLNLIWKRLEMNVSDLVGNLSESESLTLKNKKVRAFSKKSKLLLTILIK